MTDYKFCAGYQSIGYKSYSKNLDTTIDRRLDNAVSVYVNWDTQYINHEVQSSWFAPALSSLLSVQ